MKRLELFLWGLITINLTTLWVYIFKQYYIFYYNLFTLMLYFLSVLSFLLLISIQFRNKAFQFLTSLGFSFYFATPLSMYPNLVNNPDVIKILQLTRLIMENNYILAKRVDYSAFPGFSYILASISYLTGNDVGIPLAASIYIVLSTILILLTANIGKYAKNHWLFLSIVFSLGFIFSSNYLSAQMFGQIVMLTVFVLTLRMFTSHTSPWKVVPVFLASIAGCLVLHPESYIMAVLLTLTAIFVIESSIFRRFKITGRFVRVFLIIFVITAAYTIYFIVTFGPSYILEMPFVYLTRFHEVLMSLFGIGEHKEKIVTSSTVKPSYIDIYSNINIAYSGLLFLMSVVHSLRQKMVKEVAILSSFVFSSALFLVIFAMSPGEFIGRTAFGISLAIGLILTNLGDKVTKKNISTLFSLFLGVMIVVSFIARVPPGEWNVDAFEYKPPLSFLEAYGIASNSIYLYYPNYESIGNEFVIVPFGHVRYLTGVGRWVGQDLVSEAHKIVFDILIKKEAGGIVYNSNVSIIFTSHYTSK